MSKAQQLLILLLVATALADWMGDKRSGAIIRPAHARPTSMAHQESPLTGQRYKRAALDEGSMLSLSLSNGDQRKQQTAPDPSSASLQRIMNDDTSEDFTLTQATLAHVKATLEQFAMSEPYLAGQVSSGNNGNLISGWLLASNGNKPPSSPVIQREAVELDAIYSTFWAEFGPTVHSIIAERPANLGPMDLDFRCQRPASQDKLRRLVELASDSAIYRQVLDTFATELYVHCLLRKLALLELSGVSPSVLVRQVVEIYLDAPPSRQSATARQLSEAQVQTLAFRASNFDLQQSLAQHGSLEQVAGLLVLDARSSLGLKVVQPGELVAQFRAECSQLGAALARIWSNLDDLARFLSSPFADLSDLSARVKLTAPQLLYGAICAPLAQT